MMTWFGFNPHPGTLFHPVDEDALRYDFLCLVALNKQQIRMGITGKLGKSWNLLSGCEFVGQNFVNLWRFLVIGG